MRAVIKLRQITSIGLFVLVPLLFAIGIYAFLRVDPPPLLKILMVKFQNNSIFHIAWNNLETTRTPDWFVFNLPDGLWAFSFTSFLMISTKRDSSRTRQIYLLIGLLVMVGLELLQGSVLMGTFDPFDLLAIFLGFVTSVYLFSNRSGA